MSSWQISIYIKQNIEKINYEKLLVKNVLRPYIKTLYKFFWKRFCFCFFWYNYKDGTIETAKCSRKKPKYNFRGTERPFKLRKEKRPLKRDNIIKDVKNHFKLKKEIEPIKAIRNLFRSKKENKVIKNKTTENIWNLSE